MKEILTVSQLNDNIKFLLEESFDFVLVEGEISNLRRPQSGHTYFTLKDDKSQIRSVFFRPFGFSERRNSFELEEGLKVICRARLNVYLPRGEYQLVVESFEPLGIGALQKAFEQLKARLSAEGLFDERHKKDLPFMPERIGVITSPTGAVIKDILNITARRFPSVHIVVAPVRVQGSEAAGDIIQALRRLHSFGKIDVVVIARGGGSLEDLAPFNDEALAREIFKSEIPVVSAVGHETDFTICDFVADLRAPTPSAAAELIVPERLEFVSKIGSAGQRMTSAFSRYLAGYEDDLDDMRRRLKDPRRFVVNLKINVDDLKDRITAAFSHRTQNLRHELGQLQLRLAHRTPAVTIRERSILLKNIEKDLCGILSARLKTHKDRLLKNAAVLESLNPLAVLQRGYSITRSVGSGAVIRQTEGLTEGQDVNVLLARGSFNAKIQKIF